MQRWNYGLAYHPGNQCGKSSITNRIAGEQKTEY